MEGDGLAVAALLPPSATAVGSNAPGLEEVRERALVAGGLRELHAYEARAGQVQCLRSVPTWCQRILQLSFGPCFWL
jgi:hypothetical protein